MNKMIQRPRENAIFSIFASVYLFVTCISFDLKVGTS